MKRRGKKERGLGQQRAEGEAERTGGSEGSEEEAEKSLRAFGYLKVGSLWNGEERSWHVEKGPSFPCT